jgi:hypothetical protein
LLKKGLALQGAVVKKMHIFTERLKKEALCMADLSPEW